MKRPTIHRVLLGLASAFAFSTPVSAQITSNEGDGVLNAPYRGTIDSLRECSMDIGYGEVQSHVEPFVTGLFITSSTIDIWVEGDWDRSVLRMYEGVDASENEIDLTGTSEFSPAIVFTDADDIKRFSFKAIGTKTLAEQSFTIRFSYSADGFPTSPTRVFTVAPITGSFCALPGESEAFLLGTPILDVAVGNARLTVPVGRTAETIGAAFSYRDRQLGPAAIEKSDVVFPGAAESLFIQNISQFKLGGGSLTANKTSWGTPWPGHLVGFFNSADIYGSHGTHYDTPSLTTDGMYRFNYVRPLRQSEFHPASVQYVYDDDFNNRVTKIRDHPTDPNEQHPDANVITLERTAGVVTRITTSDGRGWDIQSDEVEGWITGVIPDGGNGARSFTYNSAGRVTEVRDAGNALMYEFIYANDPGGAPTILTEERHFIDGALQKVVEHEIVSESLRRRKEYAGTGEFRQFDFAYDTANGLNHRLASITSYDGLNGTGTPFTTTFTHDVGNPDGSMVITQVDLPDGTTINHEYDAHIGGQTVDFGFRTRSTRTGPNDGSLITFDMDYEFFYQQSGTRLFYRPRIVKQRDGRGVLSEVTFDYDNGGQYVDDWTEVRGQDLNRLLSITGPTINAGPSAPRTPETRLVYGSYFSTDYWLHGREVDYDAANARVVQYAHDELLRVTSQTVDPGGENLVTQFLFCDTAATQGRITVDPDGFWTRTRFDNDGRVTVTERFLNIDAGNPGSPCADPTDPVYRTTNLYDGNGRLVQQIVENKNQDGQSLSPAEIITEFTNDRLGRLTLQKLDPGGIAQESNFDYNWLGEIEREFDTSGRGTSRIYDGRGLVKTETPLALNEAPNANLSMIFEYDAMGNLRFINRPTGAVEERVYDDFDRLEKIKRIPGPDGGNTITTTFEYDNANNVTRTVVDDNAAVLSDTTALYDEGGFNYESRQRTEAGQDLVTDPLTERGFDWAGNVTVQRSFGDATVGDRVITTIYDGANRVERITDSEGGETAFTTRDGRGNVTERTVKLNATDSAVTTMVYDALSRMVQVTEPEDGAGGRPDRVRRYDSRGNLRRERIRDAADAPKMTTVFAYDNAGRQARRAVLADATAATDAAGADVTTDRVVDFVYEADGRLQVRRTYNNNSATPLETATTYDDLGRVDRVTDPSGSFTDQGYAANGRLSQRAVFDGVGTRTFTFGYDGHDRTTRQTALGFPDLVTTFELDGLDRQTRSTDARGIIARTDFDLIGRRTRLVEDETGALERQTDFGYNRLSQLITQTARNKVSDGTPLADQLTTYRYDSLGRQTRIVYPDSGDHADPAGCTDCVRSVFDLAGRMTQRTDQRGLATAFAYDDRSLLLTRTTGTDRDTFGYDGVGRMTLAQRGTTVDPDAVSGDVMAYTDLGDLDFESQTIADGTARTVDYNHDQAGNRIQLTYPGGDVLAYTPTVLDQVDTVNLNAAPFLDYDYNGRLLDKRRTITSDPGGNTVYEYDIGYDSHRRVNAIINRFEPGGGGSQTVVAYVFSHDNNGNPLTQTTTEGMATFVADDRAFAVDRLNRLTDTEYFENGKVESTTFDLVGNRESHTNRAATVTAYGTVNPANEYPTIGGSAVTYDDAGNITVDQDGRQYTYDEQNRLIQIKASDDTVLANYNYDALGRRIVFEDPVAAVTTRYYYDGQSVIEERDAADARVRFHVNGAQFIDERVTTFEESASEFTYYLVNQNFSIAGMGNADGSVIERLDYSSTGDFAGGGPGAASFYHDADDDLDLDLRDFASFQNCFGQTDPACLAVHDFDTVDPSDGDIDLDDYARFFECFRGPFVTPDQTCGILQRSGAPPPSGTFALHGRPVDILSDGHALIPIRARYYDAVNGRWLQRDPRGYVDGVDLYEAFKANATTNVDPLGTEVWAEARRVKTTLNGVPVWRVDYVLNKDGVSLGFGGLIWGSAVESQHAGTEFFRFTDDLREIRRIDSLMENQRKILEDLQVANIQVASLERGIKTAATVAVALPVAAVAAPVAGTVFGSSLVGTTAAGATTGAVSFGAGGATGEALIGGSLTDIAIAGGENALIGGVLGGAFGAGGKLLAGRSSAVVLSENTAQTFRGPIREITLQREATAIRVFGGKSSLTGRSEGVFLTTRRFGQLGAVELREALALPPANVANQITTVQIPAGTRLFIGRVGPLKLRGGPILRGGGTQVFIPDKSGLIFSPPRSFP